MSVYARHRVSRGQQDVIIVLLILGALLLGHRALKPDSPASPAPPGGSGEIGDVVSPVPGGTFTSGFGRRWGKNHNGADIAAPVGTPIRAIAAGEVTEAGPASGFGLWMHVRHADGTVSVYGHMNTMTKKAGAQVKAGQQIATVGMRGQSTGPHLHLEIWPVGDRSRVVNPKPWFAKHRAALT